MKRDNQPKLLGQPQDFSEYLSSKKPLIEAQKQQQLAQRQPSMPQQYYPQQGRKKFSNETYELLAGHTEQEREKVYALWKILLQVYGARLKHHYGEEPDKEIIRLAISLDESALKRLGGNLMELLQEGEKWPTSYAELYQYACSPSRKEIKAAAINLHYAKKPTDSLNRVERFLRKHHRQELKFLPQKNFDQEFASLYRYVWQRVILQNVDVDVEQRQRIVSEHTMNAQESEKDKKVSEKVRNGAAFNNKFGHRIANMLAEKKRSENGL